MPRNARSLMLNDFHGLGNYIYKNLNTNAPFLELNGVEQKKHVTDHTQYNQQPQPRVQSQYGAPYIAIDTGTSESITNHPLSQPLVNADSQGYSVNNIYSEATNVIRNENLHQYKSASVNEGTSNFNQHSRKRKTPETDTWSSQNNKKNKG